MNERARFRWDGTGLHSGTACSVEVSESSLPGIRFLFSDGESFLVEEAAPRGDSRGSTLTFPNGITIRTVEHLLSALAGLGIWSAEIRVRGGEIPALDGSAAPFARGLLPLARKGSRFKVEPLRIQAPISVRDPRRGSSLVVLPAETFGVSCVIDYPGTWIGTQSFCSENLDPEAYLGEIAPCGTFCLESELDLLRSSGLGKGGSLENTLVIGKDGPLNPGILAFPDGCVRHKVLDLVGDMALLGRSIAGHLLAFRSGHGLHLALVARLRRIGLETKTENYAKGDPSCSIFTKS